MAEEMLPQEIYLICPPSELHQQTISVESGQNNQMKSILVTDHTEGFDKMYHEDLVKKEAIDDDYPPINDIEYHKLVVFRAPLAITSLLQLKPNFSILMLTTILNQLRK